MEIAQASTEHASYLAEKLSSYFIEINKIFGYDKYKSNEQKLLEHISNRLADPNSEFKYFLLLNESGEPVGFVNTLNNQTMFEILSLHIDDTYSTYDNTYLLTNFAIQTLKSLGADKILTEVSPSEVYFMQAMEAAGAKEVERKYLIN